MLRIVITILGVIVFQDPVNADDAISKNSSYFDSPFFKALHPHTTLGTKKIEVRFGSDIYDIPANYLRGAHQPAENGGYAEFMLEVLLPDMEPKSEDNLTRFKEVGAPDILLANVEFGRQYDQPDVIIGRILMGQSKTFSNTLNGFRLYHTPQGDLYIYPSKRESTFFFMCDTKFDGPWPRCRVLENIGKSISIQYYFYVKYITSASMIDQRLKSLISSFK